MDHSRSDDDKESSASLHPIVDDWADAYAAEWLRAELLRIDLEDCSYFFDFVEDKPELDRESRVVVAWGFSRPPAGKRDKTRMKGFPRPRRQEDDRGHLLPRSGGGGYDINLIPQDSSLNRGRSAQGKKYRAMERSWAASPGALMAIRPVYGDGSARPIAFQVALQTKDGLQLEHFDN